MDWGALSLMDNLDRSVGMWEFWAAVAGAVGLAVILSRVGEWVWPGGPVDPGHKDQGHKDPGPDRNRSGRWGRS